MQIKPVTHLNGKITIPGDKSISHRSIMFGSLANGTTTISNFLMGADCLSTIQCFKSLGIDINIYKTHITVNGKGLHGLSPSKVVLDCGNSGTTVRLMSGILAAQNFSSTITGDDSIKKRPMDRIVNPLSKMGADISSNHDTLCPLHIHPSILKGIHYESPVASAQVKSAILLAGLYASSPTTVTEPYVSRDHTERMLEAFGATIKRQGTSVTVYPASDFIAQDLTIPGDISSAAFFMVAGIIIPNSHIILENVGINPTRRGILDVLIAMGGNITILNERTLCGEPICDLEVKTSKLHGITIGNGIIPTLIDEIPILAVAACFASGTTIIKDAAELKVKETNRIDAIHLELTKMGANITTTSDGLIIQGKTPLIGTNVTSYHDHRMAMSLAIAALGATGNTTISNSECVSISYPNFFEVLASLSHS